MQSFSHDGSTQFYVVGRFIGADIEMGGYYWLEKIPESAVFKKAVPHETVDEICALCRELKPDTDELEMHTMLDTTGYDLEYREGDNIFTYEWARGEYCENGDTLYKILSLLTQQMRVGVP